MNGKKVQVGRSRMLEELARPTWEAPSAPVSIHKKKETAPKQPRQKVETISSAPITQRKLRVAAYARVSTDLDSQETSIENQREHYKSFIASNPDWELAGIYEESGVSGTKADTRPELQRLIKDCEAGAVDVIVTKSISRFARNTSECLEMVRKLTGIGIRLIFEKENIDTETMESEFLLTLLAAFAESESASISTNQKWSIRRRFQAGTYKGGKVPYGYRRSKNGYVIHPAEAATVRRIFNALADGKGTVVIARQLNEDKVPTWTESFRGEEGKGRWRSNSIIAIARNEFYTGDTLYQKTFMDEGYKKRVNTGQLDQFLNEANHPAIIDHEMFRKANDAIREHGEAYGNDKARGTKRYVFSGRLRCGCCGGSMSRGKDARAFYACENHKHKRAVSISNGIPTLCPMLPVFERDVKNAFATVLNRLAAEPSILVVSDDGTERERLEAQLQSVKRRQSVLHDRALADRYTAQLREKKAALDSEEKIILDALAKLEKKNPVDDLQRAVRKRGVKETFEDSDEDLFTTFVDHAVLWSKEKAQFHFTCGLVVEEDMRVQKIGRSYAQLPVRTEFDATQKGAFTWQ
ncbi:MAG: recombinase family protein [Oscillospiraceae bacterium]|nr:recombinase family protein [Oscillospiraceae bacterium]